MSCDLAVSIAKAAVTEEHLCALLAPEIVKQVTLTYLQQQYARYNPEMLYTSGLTVGFCVGTCDLEIAQGQVTVTDVDGNTTFAEQLSTALVQLLKQLAEMLFQQRIQQILSTTYGTALTQVQSVEVDNPEVEGGHQHAVVFTLNA